MAIAKKKVCIIGGGATGTALMWCLAQDKNFNKEWDIFIIHDQEQLSGHSRALPVKQGKKTYHIDIGVQFITPPLYPNVYSMLKMPDFKNRVSVVRHEALKIACVFPNNDNHGSQSWGNFPEYQTSANLIYSQEIEHDGNLFQKFVGKSIFNRKSNQSLASHFEENKHLYKDPQKFIHYCLWPYLSIINGYGAHLMEETKFADILPLFSKLPFFASPLGSFTKPSRAWERFENGASEWIKAMQDVSFKYCEPTLFLNSKAMDVWTDNNKMVHVKWKNQSNEEFENIFDKVILTTDMWTNAELLNNESNKSLWDNLYKYYVDKSLWPLHPGMCYIHKDADMLSPNLKDELETLQFTADTVPQDAYPYYNLEKTYTTYIQKNLIGDDGAENLYVTMYGFVPDPTIDKVPSKESILFQQEWRHGMWIPAFMGGIKKQLHKAQGVGRKSGQSKQFDTNVYFAGNNATLDSEEGALIAAMIIANYAFNIQYPLKWNPLSYTVYKLFYNKVMFPENDK